MKKTSFLAVAGVMAIALIAFLGFTSEAFAAVPHVTPQGVSHVADVFLSNLHLAAVPLATMRSDLADLIRKADAKRAEAKDGMSDEELRAIETDHDELQRNIKKLQDDIAAEERREVEEASRRQNPVQADDVRAAVDAGIAAALRAERVRTGTIRELAEKAGARTLGEEHAAKDTSVEEFRKILMDHMFTEEGARGLQNSNIPAHVGETDQEKRGAAIENALMHRSNPGAYELSNEARFFRSLSLIEIARDCLEARGVSTRGKTRMEIAAMALEQRSSAGLMATGDFPAILANVVNKTLRAGYVAMPQTFRQLVTIASVPDFKSISRVQLGEAPQLEKVNEHGEFKRGSMKEGKESYAIATYGKIVGITRQVLINDDLNAFTRIPASFGVQASQLESDLVWGILLQNAAMGDSVALFHASHSNLAASGGAIAVATISAGRTAMAKQTGLDGKTVLNLTPTYLIVPTELQTTAEQFRGQIYPAKNSDMVPDSLKTLGIISEPRLSNGVHNAGIGIDVAGSAVSWYLAGQPGVIDLIELAYLDGNQGVYTETRQGFDVDGVEVKVRMDVGAKAMDWRNIYKNPGA